jgi:hypothetical protein
MIMVLLVVKLFVSSRPLKLENVLCIYVLLLHEGQAENHFAMFFYMIETHTWLSLFHYSWSFVCVTFHVITWLLSFIVKIMSFVPMFRVLWSQHSMLYIIDQDCDGACHLKNYCFVITSWCFYAFYRTNPLTICHSASSLFLPFLCFRKATQEIFSELD